MSAAINGIEATRKTPAPTIEVLTHRGVTAGEAALTQAILGQRVEAGKKCRQDHNAKQGPFHEIPTSTEV